MATQYLSEIRLMAFNFAPHGWAMCNGQFLTINQNQALFSLLGTMYGGDGVTTFALPDLRGRVPIHMGAGFTLGDKGGAEWHYLSASEMPAHVHLLQASAAAGNSTNPNFGGAGRVLAADPGNAYAPSFSPGLAELHGASVANRGASQAHENMQPYLTICFCIALQGAFPSQN